MPELWLPQSGVNRKQKELWLPQGGVSRKQKELWAASGGVNRKIFSGGVPYTLSVWSEIWKPNFKVTPTLNNDGSGAFDCGFSKFSRETAIRLWVQCTFDEIVNKQSFSNDRILSLHLYISQNAEKTLSAVRASFFILWKNPNDGLTYTYESTSSNLNKPAYNDLLLDFNKMIGNVTNDQYVLITSNILSIQVALMVSNYAPDIDTMTYATLSWGSGDIQSFNQSLSKIGCLQN